MTASITWIVLIYPALGRLRSLARRVHNLAQAQDRSSIDLMEGTADQLLSDLSNAVIRTRVDFIHFPLIYYFHSDTQGASLAKALQYLDAMANRGRNQDRSAEIRLSATLLLIALENLAETMAAKFLRAEDQGEPKKIFQAVARYHGLRQNQ